MLSSRWNWRRIRSRLFTGLAVPAGLCLALSGQANEQLGQPSKAPPVVVAEGSPASLAAYRAIALERQPALAAYRASASAAEAKESAVDHLRILGIIRRDLPSRRMQAEQGVLAAQAQLRKAEYETLYGVTRTYLSVLYARQQLALADRALDKRSDAVTSLYYLKNVAEDIYKNTTRRDVKKWNVDQIDVLIQTTLGRREQARVGIDRALAGLREAVGLELECPIALDPKEEMPLLRPNITREQMVALALERRGEIVQSAAGLEVTSLEITAQKRTFGLRGETFGAGSDLHADPVPQGIANGDYRPGAISIEMPGQLVGCRHARVEQAEALQGRAAAVVDKTRQLITLEAEDSYLKWVESSREADEYTRAAKLAETVADEIREAFKPKDAMGGKPTLDELVDARVRAVQLQLLANQARYQALLALAALERVTAGGFNPGFDLIGAKKP